jgi:hypothetical protein
MVHVTHSPRKFQDTPHGEPSITDRPSRRLERGNNKTRRRERRPISECQQREQGRQHIFKQPTVSSTLDLGQGEVRKYSHSKTRSKFIPLHKTAHSRRGHHRGSNATHDKDDKKPAEELGDHAEREERDQDGRSGHDDGHMGGSTSRVTDRRRRPSPSSAVRGS